MDIQRKAFERLPLAKLAIESEYVYYNKETNSYWPNEDFCPSDAPETMNFAWEAWQVVKAQAVLEWISTSDRMPKEGEEVLVHSLGQVRQVTRDSKWAGGFKERNCYGWQAAYGQSHWMPKSIGLPEEYHFYYKNDAKQKAMIEAQEQSND